MKKASNILRSICSSTAGSISSKRVAGLLGWATSLFIMVYCTIQNTQAPLMIDTVVITSAALLGVDSVMKPFKGVVNESTNKEYAE